MVFLWPFRTTSSKQQTANSSKQQGMASSTPATASSLGAGAIDSSQYQEQGQGIYHVLGERPARLFLGTQKAAQNRQLLRRHEVSRIVCVGTPAFHRNKGVVVGEGKEGRSNDDGDSSSSNSSSSSSNGFTYLEVPVLDLPSENLLARLDECTSFIEDGLRRGQGVFVNCVFAQSRSAAVVVAYLMKHKDMSLARGIAEVRKAQPTMHINPGFEAQLTLYQHMGCSLPGSREGDEPASASAGTAAGAKNDPISAVAKKRDQTIVAGKKNDPINFLADATYRWFLFACGVRGGDDGYLQRLQPLGSSGKNYRGVGSNGDPVPAPFREGCGGAAVGVASGTRAGYRCRACRAPLFLETNVVDHLHPVVQAASDSVYASFSRHGDGSSWLAAREAAAAAAPGSSATASLPSSSFGGRAPGSKTTRVGKGTASLKYRQDGGLRETGGRVSAVGVASPVRVEMGSCTSVFTEVLEWIEIFGVCRGGVGWDPRRSFGKILCPGRRGRRGGSKLEGGGEAVLCNSKLGSWSLDGVACSCGRMVNPAVQFTLSRIERVVAA